MRAAIRWGALFLLVLIAAPLLRLTGDVRYVALIGWAAAYLLFRSVFPPSKQGLVAALALSVGLLCPQILSAVHWWGRSPVAPAEAAVTAALLIWLFIRPGKIPAALLILVYLIDMGSSAYVLVTGSVGEFWWLIGMATTLRVVAIYLLAEVGWGEGRSEVARSEGAA